MATTRAVICDVNETLLDLVALDPLFVEWFGMGTARGEWFSLTLHYVMALAATHAYRPFGEVGAAALRGLAQRRGTALPGDAVARLRDAVLGLPAHPDVRPALSALREAGLTVAALSNNALSVLHEQLRRSGLASAFDQVISVEEAGALKPAPEVYEYAVKRLDVVASETWMVAAHGWDIAGAQRAGLRGAFVARPGQFPDPFSPPEITASNLLGISAAIVETC